MSNNRPYQCHYCEFSNDDAEVTFQHMLSEHDRRKVDRHVDVDRRHHSWINDLTPIHQAVIK